MRLHLYGTSAYLPDAACLSAEDLSRQSGGNTGNLMFCHSISRMTGAGPDAIPWGAPLDTLDPAADLLVLPLANQLGSHVDLGVLADRMARHRVPMVGLGLGAQGPIDGVDAAAIPPGSWKWLRLILERSVDGKPNVALRGEETLRVVQAQGLAEGCVVTGCPSNFIHPSPTLGREIARRRFRAFERISVAAGNPFLPQHKVLEQGLRGLVEATNGTYVCQHPIDMLRLAKLEYRGIERSTFATYRDYIHPELDDDDFLIWFRAHAHAYASVPEWLATMARHDLVVGTRIHGILAGIQAGVPSVCLCIDSRTRELCRTMAIPYADANEFRDGIGIDDIRAILAAWDGRHYDETRRMLGSRLARVLRDNRIEPRGALQALLRPQLVGAGSKDSEVVEVSPSASPRSSLGPSPAILSALASAVQVVNPDVLCVGCADGHLLDELATRYFHHGRIVGCDADPEARRIADLCNARPGRVQVVDADPQLLAVHGPYDVIVALGAEQIEGLLELLVPGGVLCVHGCQGRVVDSPAIAPLEIIEISGTDPAAQAVRRFDASGRPRAEPATGGVLFRKIVAATDRSAAAS